MTLYPCVCTYDAMVALKGQTGSPQFLVGKYLYLFVKVLSTNAQCAIHYFLLKGVMQIFKNLWNYCMKYARICIGTECCILCNIHFLECGCWQHLHSFSKLVTCYNKAPPPTPQVLILLSYFLTCIKCITFYCDCQHFFVIIFC